MILAKLSLGVVLSYITLEHVYDDLQGRDSLGVVLSYITLEQEIETLF